MRRYPTRSMLCAGVAALALVAACGDSETSPGTTSETDTTSDTSADTTATDTAVTDTGGGETTTCGAGDSCDDGDPCTENDQCDADGACAGTAKSCDDGLVCTTDSCGADGTCAHAVVSGFCVSEQGENSACVADGTVDPLTGCRTCDASGATPIWTAFEDDASCEDADMCTTGGTCQSGVCVASGTLDCESDDPCSAGSCEPAQGCVYTNTTAACDDGDPCSVGDTCSGGACTAGSETLACDDGDACTADSCVPGEGCLFDPDAVCDDGDPCTNDSCSGNANCSNVAFTGACDDGNPCTIDEVCNEAGTCGGGTVNTCDDGNTCTLDSCHPVLGCINNFADQACDDGAECTVDDRCVAGECFGAKTNQCTFCNLAGTDHANRITSLMIVSDGNQGSGLDVDGDPSTCAPAGQCGAGVDNALGIVAFLVNEGLNTSVSSGVVNWVVDLRDASFEGASFSVPIYDSSMDELQELAGCDRQTELCSYDIAQLSMDQTCTPYFAFDNATIVDDTLEAGGTDQLISMVLPLEGGDLLAVTVAWARVRAKIIVEDGKIVAMNGVIAGAIPKLQLRQAILGLDPDSLPIDRDAAVALLDDESVIPSDIDLDGDGVKESLSVGMRISTIPAVILDEP